MYENISFSVSVYCKDCGDALKFDIEYDVHEIIVNTEACPNCIEMAEDKSYKEGFADGEEAGG